MKIRYAILLSPCLTASEKARYENLNAPLVKETLEEKLQRIAGIHRTQLKKGIDKYHRENEYVNYKPEKQYIIKILGTESIPEGYVIIRTKCQEREILEAFIEIWRTDYASIQLLQRINETLKQFEGILYANVIAETAT